MQTPQFPDLFRQPSRALRIVVVGQTRLGGFLCTIPALRAIKQAAPAAKITMITVPALRELVNRSPYLDQFVPLPDLMFEQEERPIKAREFTLFLQSMQAECFDVGLQLRGYGLRASPFFALLGASTNVGFLGPADMPLLDAGMPFPKQGHMIDRYLVLSASLGAPSSDRRTEFALYAEDHAAAATLLAKAQKPLIGIHPTASEAERVWPSERFAAVANALQSCYGGTVVIVTEQEGDPAASQIAMQVNGPCLNLAGKTSLSTLGAVIQMFSVLVTNDTGPGHISYALQIPTVTLFASITKTAFSPPDTGPFRPLLCPASTAADEHMLEAISVHDVILAAKEIFSHD